MAVVTGRLSLARVIARFATGLGSKEGMKPTEGKDPPKLIDTRNQNFQWPSLSREAPAKEVKSGDRAMGSVPSCHVTSCRLRLSG
jgi:hypothetical protein